MTLRAGPRALVLLMLAAAAGLIAFWARWDRDADTSRLSWVATAQQFGPVGYRDPAGALSPDGRWIAYSEGRFLRVRSVDGGPAVGFPPGEAQIRNIAWSPDNRTILTDGHRTQTGWAAYDRLSGSRRVLWDSPEGTPDLRQLAWSPDGRSIAAVANGDELRILSPSGALVRAQKNAHRIAFPAWTPAGEVACVATVDGRSRVTIPCGGAAVHTDPDLDVYGPFAFAPDGRTIYLSFANSSGFVDLWAAPSSGGRARRLTSFARDTYAPSVAADGTVLFRVQSYRTVVAARAGRRRRHATARDIPERNAVVGAGWTTDRHHLRHLAKIDRRCALPGHRAGCGHHRACLSAPARRPSCTRPSPKIRRCAGRRTAAGSRFIRTRISPTTSGCARRKGSGAAARQLPRPRHGGGLAAVVARWPLDSLRRRQPNIEGICQLGDRRGPGHRRVDEPGGRDRGDRRQRRGEPAEWLPDSDHIAVLAKEGPGRHVIYTVSRGGGPARIVHRFESEHDAPVWRCRRTAATSRSSRPRRMGFFRCSGCRFAGGVPTARDLGSVAQDAAGLVA
jgi:hypothetical protein